MNEKDFNIAILGFGFMGKVYSLAADSIKHFFPDIPSIVVKSVLVSKRTDSKKILELKKRYGFKLITKDYLEILNDKEIDAIYIATPNNVHFEQIAQAIKYNKHILCDKPMVLNLEESIRVVKLKKTKPNLIFNIVFEYRFIPAIQKIKNLIDNYELGDLLQFRVAYLHGSYISKRPITWRLKPKTGGATIDLGPHVLDLVNFLIGKINILYSLKEAKMKNREVDDIGIINCKADGNVDGIIEVSRVASGSVDNLRLEIHGTKGSIKWNLEDLNFFDFFTFNAELQGYKRVPCFKNIEESSDFPPPKVTSGWLMANFKCLYYFVKQIIDKDFNDKYPAKIEDAHNVQVILNEI